MIKTKRKCDHSECNNPHFAKGYCKWHQYLRPDYKKPEFKQTKIKPVSKKKAALDRAYSILRKKFLEQPENKYCPVMKQLNGSNVLSTEIHHKMGRVGYADDFSRLNDIPLYIDERYFLAVSRKGHVIIEQSPIWAKENGYSLNRF